MPFTTNRGCNIHYEVEGEGPLVVLQHGFLGNAEGWKLMGYVDALTDKYTVATVDSLGHGDSDKPVEAERYRLQERAGDIVAVIDNLGADKAHLLGYSMGGWLSVGVAKYYPERLRSVVVAGWDCVNGMASAIGSDKIEFEAFMTMARQAAPELTDWVTGAIAEALDPCLVQLHDIEGSEQAILDLAVPVMFWNGQADEYHDPMLRFSREHGYQFLSTDGDHVEAMMIGAAQIMPTFRAFLARAD